MKYAGVLVDRYYDFYLGVTVSIQNRFKDDPRHFHLLLALGLFYIEFRLGKEEIDD